MEPIVALQVSEKKSNKKEIETKKESLSTAAQERVYPLHFLFDSKEGDDMPAPAQSNKHLKKLKNRSGMSRLARNRKKLMRRSVSPSLSQPKKHHRAGLL